ncbi:hypothetical protein [Sulfitobacter sp. SH24]|uniref:hypothetical protein n=1 Tax=Sulfitobacter sp. SH24 TaxID=3421173 RepID=UPI003F507ED0
MTATHLRAVDGISLPEYPEELCDPRLTSDYFTMFWHDRWLSSTLHLTAPMAVQGAALNLFFLSRKQTPVGSLPVDDKVIARLLRVDLSDWLGWMAQPVTPLHNWRRYEYGEGEVYGHPVVIEVARDALQRREVRKASVENKAIYQRQQRLVDVMREMRCDKALLADKVLVERLDAWLMQNHSGQRRMPQFEASVTRALNHAVHQGWIGGKGSRH